VAPVVPVVTVERSGVAVTASSVVTARHQRMRW
jgi:hypothetical protein